MPSTRWFPAVVCSSSIVFTVRLARFLCNNLPGYVGPGWTIVKAYDASQGTAALRLRTPTAGDEGDMDNAEFSHDAFGWQTGSLGAGDWIVLRSRPGPAGTQFELYIEYESTTVMYLKVIPLNDFVGNDASPPTFPATSFGSGTGLCTMPTYATGARYTVVADESTAHLISDNVNTPNWVYVGEVDTARLNGNPPDDRPYVCRNGGGNNFGMHWGNRYSRLSPVDDLTVLDAGGTCIYGTEFGYYAATLDKNMLGEWAVLPIGMFFNATGHVHWMGYLRLCGSLPDFIGDASGVLKDKDWAKRGRGGIMAWEWDGVTEY